MFFSPNHGWLGLNNVFQVPRTVYTMNCTVHLSSSLFICQLQLSWEVVWGNRSNSKERRLAVGACGYLHTYNELFMRMPGLQIHFTRSSESHRLLLGDHLKGDNLHLLGSQNHFTWSAGLTTEGASDVSLRITWNGTVFTYQVQREMSDNAEIHQDQST